MIDETNPNAGVAPLSDAERVLSILSRQDTEQPAEAPAEPEAVPQIPQEAQDEQAQTDELTPDDIPDEAEAPSVSADEFEIVHNGQQRKLTREETIRLAQQGFDYTQKTQKLADEARQVGERLERLREIEAASEVLADDRAAVKAFQAQLDRFKEVDWVKLANDDPLEYPKVRAQYDTLLQGAQMAWNQYQARRQAVSEQMNRIKVDTLSKEAEKLAGLIPAWSDSAKLEAARKEISDAIKAAGYDPSVIGGRYLDNALTMAWAWKAVQYDKLQKAKSEKVKSLRTAPPLVKPGATQTPVSQNVEREREARARLKKTGSLEDAAALLLNRGKR